MAAKQINWSDMNSFRFYSYQAAIFMGIRALIYPNSVIKTHLQVSKEQSIVRTYQAIVQRSGFRGLWKGFLTLSAGIMPAQMFYFSTLEVAKEAVVKTQALQGHSTVIRDGIGTFVGGGLASAVSQTIIVPVDVVTSRLMIQGSAESRTQYTGGLDAFSKILKSEGPKGLYRGYLASVLTYAPFSAIWWGTYDVAKNTAYKWTGIRQGDSGVLNLQEWVLQASCGSLAAVTGVMCTNPMDVVKTRMQTTAGSHAAVSGGIAANLRQLIKDDGFLALTRGSGIRIFSALPFSVLGSVGYEVIKQLSVNVNNDT